MKQVLSVLLFLMLMAGGSLKGQAIKLGDPWEGLRFLVGNWEAKTTGGKAGASGTGTYFFRLELKGHVLARHSAYEACRGPEDFDCQHGDLLYIYPEGPGQELRAIYFDNEGHVIHYRVSASKPGMVAMVSDAAEPGPQFRLTYELSGDTMTGKFEMKMPGQTDFGTYLEWSGRRKDEEKRP